MNVRYRVTLTQDERSELAALLNGGKQPARKLKRAQILLAADAGVEATAFLIEQLRREARRTGLETAEQLKDALKQQLTALLKILEQGEPWGQAALPKPYVIMLAGVNGAGKTSLLRVLVGLEPLVRGEGQVLGYDLTSSHRRHVRRHVGWRAGRRPAGFSRASSPGIPGGRPKRGTPRRVRSSRTRG